MGKCILGRVQESPQGFYGDCWPWEQNQPRKKLSLTTDLQGERAVLFKWMWSWQKGLQTAEFTVLPLPAHLIS